MVLTHQKTNYVTRSHCFWSGIASQWTRKAYLWPKMTKNANFWPKILILKGGSKTVGTLISGNLLYACLFRVKNIDRQGSNEPQGTKKGNFDPNFLIFGTKIFFVLFWKCNFSSQIDPGLTRKKYFPPKNFRF